MLLVALLSQLTNILTLELRPGTDKDFGTSKITIRHVHQIVLRLYVLVSGLLSNQGK